MPASAAAGTLRGWPLGASTRATVDCGRLLPLLPDTGSRQPASMKSLLWLITPSGTTLGRVAADTLSVCRVARRLAMLPLSSAPIAASLEEHKAPAAPAAAALLPPPLLPPATRSFCCVLAPRVRYIVRLLAAAALAASAAAAPVAAEVCLSSSDWLVLGRHTRPEVRGPVLPAVLLPLMLPANSCWGVMPLRAALLLLPLLLERAMCWLLPLLLLPLLPLLAAERWSRSCLRERSDMLLSSSGVAGAARLLLLLLLALDRLRSPA